MNLNKIFIIGNLTRDPELRTTPSGQPVATFGVATNRFFVDSSGQKKQQTEFHNVVAWGKLAEIANQYLNKGKVVFIEGRLSTRSWTAQDGTKRSKTEIITERMQLGPRTSQRGMSQDNSSNSIPKDEEIPVIEQNDSGDVDTNKDIPF
ncbi:single-stranded DNA-binding protein [Candidatus Parcubacteria bacterium]|nr:MAG: single-stranded DNA-binding protein [Candidatus Parcubacteria bacterium]